MLVLVAGAWWGPAAQAQEFVPDTVTMVKAEVVEVLSEETRLIPGTDTETVYQTIKAKLLEGEDAGRILTLDNDYLRLDEGEVFYALHTVNELEGRDVYAVSEPYRLPVLFTFAAIFLACLVIFGGVQGIRGFVALAASLLLIVYVLLPGILAGYPPLAVAIGVASIIVIAGSYITHGFNRTTTTAVAGMLATIAVTGALAYVAVHWGRLSGFSSEEATYLNFTTRGSIDFVGLLLGSLIIGLLGVLYDAAISQSIAVEELLGMNKDASRAHVFARALRIGREHIGALVNTLAIAYVGAYLPLLLFFTTLGSDPLMALNQEIFATEVLRTLVGAIGIMLAVPITTGIAVAMLHGRVKPGVVHAHRH